jgi:hypothetical protein
MDNPCDVIVIGSGPGGFTAAIAAAELGMEVLLLEKNPFAGGLAVSGMPWLGMADHGGVQLVHGVAHSVIQTLRRSRSASAYLNCPAHGGYVTIDPEAGKLVITEALQQAGVRIRMHTLSTEAIMAGNRVIGVRGHGKDGYQEFKSKMIIDATGDGDIAASAGAHYDTGNARGELQPVTMLMRMAQVDFRKWFAYLSENPDEVRLHDGYDATLRPTDIVGHEQFCFAGMPGKLKEAREKEGYVPALGRVNFSTNPEPGTITVNCTRVHMIDGTSPDDLTKAEIEGRRQADALARFMKRYIPGFENAIVMSSNYQIGVRESRHIHGLTTLKEDDAVNGRQRVDGVAKGAYAIDIHDPHDHRIHLKPIKGHFDIPYGCLVPAGIDGLLVSGRAISVDAVAFGASRVMGTCMAVGEAAGVAAALAIRQGVQPGGLDPQAVRSLLVDRGALKP